VPRCPSQILYELTQERTRASLITGRRLTAWAMVRPTSTFYIHTQDMKSTRSRSCPVSTSATTSHMSAASCPLNEPLTRNLFTGTSFQCKWLQSCDAANKRANNGESLGRTDTLRCGEQVCSFH
jgi:hypothetical protein